MRTPIIIITAIFLVLASAFVVRFVLHKNPLKSNEKHTKVEKGNKEEKTENLNDSKVNILKRWDLPEILKEISAHAYMDAERFACVQDELGKIFIYNTSTEKIEKEIPFAPAGDYEGLALNGSTAWVLRADGQLFEISNFNQPKPQVEVYKTSFTEKQDTEGLAFDKTNNRLLISVKGKDPQSDDYKGIYAFDLSSKELQKEPAFKIDLQNELFADSKSTKKKKKKDDGISPSDIAIHPLSGDLYLTDGGKQKLLIMDKTGKILSLITLDDSSFSQPEGLSFSPEGSLFISNEGTKKAGNILEVAIR